MALKEKMLDLPPRGPRNPDPITDAAGAHPIETGVGTVLGGAAAGFVAGVMAGPVGAVAGAIIGGATGGLAGKGIGEWIDPTTDDWFLQEQFKHRYSKDGKKYEDYVPVYQYGGRVESSNLGKTFAEVETGIQKDYENTKAVELMPWETARPAVEDAYNRAKRIREERNVKKS
jgi:hypothetical protein